MLKARYRAEETAVTPEEADNKYFETNVICEYSSRRAMKLVRAEYDKADEASRRTFQS